MDTTTPAALPITRDVDAPAEDVWAVLSDGWLYASWVVGASRIREVDADFPAVGSRIHHSVGLWPLLIDDETVVLEVEAPTRLLLKARAWPSGEAHVEITVTSTGPSSSRVTIVEDAVKGPGRLVPKVARQAGIGPRNIEAMRRLAYLAERRA